MHLLAVWPHLPHLLRCVSDSLWPSDIADWLSLCPSACPLQHAASTSECDVGEPGKCSLVPLPSSAPAAAMALACLSGSSFTWVEPSSCLSLGAWCPFSVIWLVCAAEGAASAASPVCSAFTCCTIACLTCSGSRSRKVCISASGCVPAKANGCQHWCVLLLQWSDLLTCSGPQLSTQSDSHVTVACAASHS